MTEDEAKTKICHQSIDGNDSPAPVIGNEMFAKKFACVASSCMAWRWHPNWGESAENTAEVTELPPIQGFCGLAGRP